MKKIRALYHFLGSVYFALILIATVTIFVISGTFIEAATQSHRYAALFTYNSPLFALLLWGFFINILFSATRRWPFKQKHIPFLTTHLGLLMLLAGVLAKHYFGVQGTMSLKEGIASHSILEPNTYILHVEGRDGKPARHPLKKSIWGKHQPDLAKEDDFAIQLIEYYPHCQEHLTSWVHGIHAFLIGLPPMPLSEASFDKGSLPLAGVANLQGSKDSLWNLYALKTSDLPKTLSQLYNENAQIKITDRATEKILNLEALSTLAEISLNINAQNELIDPQINVKYEDYPQIIVPLAAENALLNLHEGLQLGSLPIAIDIIQQPFLAIIKDQGNVFLFAADAHGKIWSKSYSQGIPDLLVAYDDGFAGYTTKVELPFKAYHEGRQKREEALAYQLTLQLYKALEERAELSPPLQLLYNACKKTGQDFAKTCTSFLSHWNSTNEWLYPKGLPLPENQRQVFANIDWKNNPGKTKQGCEWVVQLFNLIAPDLKTHGGDLLTVLRDKNWPLVAALETEIAKHQDSDETMPYTLLTHQLFAASELVPLNEETPEEVSPEIHASLFSAYLRAYGIHLASLIQVPKEEEMDQLLFNYMLLENKDLNNDSIHLETPVSSLSVPAIPTKKLEENRPKIKVFFDQGEKKQSISLAYDPSGTGLKWPILHGEYLTRFQPSFKEIPYRIRLRQARQVNYANSSQPYSFESDLIITDQRNQISIEKTISMNNVHETWDGYRFYLSSITPSDETAVKHIQIVVNYDPAKYLLTYPGAIVLSCGILMLFIMRPYRRSKS